MGGIQGTGLPTIAVLSDKERKNLSSVGEVFTEATDGINSIRLFITNASQSNIVTVSGSVDGSNWKAVGSVMGSNTAILDVQAYKMVKIEVTSFGGTPFDLFWSTETHPAAYGIVDKNGDQAEITDGKVHVLAEVTNDLSGEAQTINTFNEINSVPSQALTTVVTYTVPLTGFFRVNRVEFSGSNVGDYTVLLDGNVIAKRRTWFGGEISGSFEFGGSNRGDFEIPAGSIIKLKVFHRQPSLGDFEGRILGTLTTP